jgi:hypothetical protein
VRGSMLGWRMRSEMVNSYSLMELPVEFSRAPLEAPLLASVDRDLDVEQGSAHGRTARP